MIDFPRLVTIVAEVVVIGIWLIVFVTNVPKIHKSKNIAVKLTYMARFGCAAGIILLTAASMHGFITFWNEPVNIRVPLALLAMAFFAPSGLALLKIPKVSGIPFEEDDQ